MASKINADTSGGLKLTSDTSGVIEFQSAGTTKAGVNGTGLTGNGSQLTALTSGNLTGALPAISGAALTGLASVTELANFATTSGTTVNSPTLNLSTYKFIILVCNGVGLDGDTGAEFRMTPNGGSVGKIAPGWGTSKKNYQMSIIDLSNGIGLGIGNIASDTAAIVGGAGGTALFRNSGLTTSTTSLAFSTSSSPTFDTGSIKIYGLK
jgi:hypothetical protein